MAFGGATLSTGTCLRADYFTAEGNIIEASEVYTDEPQEVEITIDNDGNPQEEGVIQLQVSR